MTRNTLALLLGRIGTQGAAFLLTLLLARGLDEAALGVFALVSTAVFVGNVFTTFGMDTLLLRAVARHPTAEEAPLWPALMCQLLLSAVVVAVIWLWPAAGWPLKIYSVSLVPLAFTTVWSAILRGREQMMAYAAGQLLAAAGRVVLAAVALVGWGTLTAVFVALLLGQLLEMGVMGLWVAQKPVHLIRPERWREAIWHVARQGAALAAVAGVAVLYQRTPLFLLAAEGTLTQVGWFTAASRVSDLPRLLPYALVGVLFPRLTRQAPPPSLWRGLVGGAVMAAVLVQPMARPLMSLLYGGRYAPATPILQILVWSWVGFVGVLYGSMVLVAHGREKTLLAVHAMALLLLVVVGHMFFNQWGLIGFCWAVVLVEGVQAAVLAFILHNVSQKLG